MDPEDAKRIQSIKFDQLSTESDRPKATGLANLLGQKLRSLLKALEKRFYFSVASRVDDVSSMTIEYLYARLQAQRRACKTQKQRAQQLLKKVAELEHKLKWESTHRGKAECEDVVLSSRLAGSSSLGDCSLGVKGRSHSDECPTDEEGITVVNCQPKEGCHDAINSTSQHWGGTPFCMYNYYAALACNCHGFPHPDDGTEATDERVPKQCRSRMVKWSPFSYQPRTSHGTMDGFSTRRLTESYAISKIRIEDE